MKPINHGFLCHVVSRYNRSSIYTEDHIGFPNVRMVYGVACYLPDPTVRYAVRYAFTHGFRFSGLALRLMEGDTIYRLDKTQ